MVRLHAADALLDRGIGRPIHSPIEHQRASGNQIIVITGVPEPDEEESPEYEIEGEVVKNGNGADVS